jgi:hypothetical protein
MAKTVFDSGWLAELVSAKTSEDETLDFKRELPAAGDKGRAELLKDVCAFANLRGGVLVYGVAERAGQAETIFPITKEPADLARRRSGQIIENGIEPRLTGYSFTEIPADPGYVLALSVPSAFGGPYRFLTNGTSKFVVRSGTHTAEFSYSQLPDAFDRRSNVADRMKAWRAERLMQIKAGKTWRPLQSGPVSVMHVTPVMGFLDNLRTGIDVSKVYQDFTKLTMSNWRHLDRAFNLDGVIVYSGSTDKGTVLDYVQVFRNGAAELASFAGSIMNRRQDVSIMIH